MGGGEGGDGGGGGGRGGVLVLFVPGALFSVLGAWCLVLGAWRLTFDTLCAHIMAQGINGRDKRYPTRPPKE